MVYEMEPEKQRRRVHGWVKINERPVTNSGEHVVIYILGWLNKANQFSLHFFKPAATPIHESMAMFGTNNIEQPVGIYEEGVVEKRDRVLEMAFGYPATLFVSSAPEEVRIMMFAPLIQQGCNGQKFIVNETRNCVFFKPTEYLGKCGKRMDIYRVLMAELAFLRARQMLKEVKKFILVR
jgi:hypothetical protein